MRDVTDSATSPLKEIARKVVSFIKHPITEIQNLPDWSWGRLLILNALFAMLSGILMGFLPPNFYRIAAGILISPLVSTIMNGLMSLFLYYYFQVFEYRTVSFRRLFTQTFFASIPFFLFQTISEYLPPISLLGFALTGLIMVVGLVENFQLEKKRAIKLMSIVIGVVFLVWLWNRIDIARLG